MNKSKNFWFRVAFETIHNEVGTFKADADNLEEFMYSLLAQRLDIKRFTEIKIMRRDGKLVVPYEPVPEDQLNEWNHRTKNVQRSIAEIRSDFEGALKTESLESGRVKITITTE